MQWKRHDAVKFMFVLPIAWLGLGFDTSPKREAISRSANIFREMFQVVNRIVTNSSHFLFGMLKVRFLVLIQTPI